jgi:hypothetical protein
MANRAVFSFGLSIAGDGSSTTYSFNPSNGSGILGLPTNSAQAVLSVSQNSGPTSPALIGSVLLGVVTLTFSSALQAVASDLSNLYNFEIALGY